MMTTFLPKIGMLAASENSTPSLIFQIFPPLGLGATMFLYFQLTLLYVHG